ncbi:tripartite motif-containing protein 43A-like [Mesocricetus auratus]|uniref:Tripartite motif-containing protein 43A-like n=1 Tax=Mesocricetus auratus TaxID=10036 RepID=A0ABM2WEL4_MESAU|nr:tripartite motif-containing protein 43A-like [Mesocricetus auratus]
MGEGRNRYSGSSCTPCGYSLCRACLHLFREEIQFPVHCPMCREPSLTEGLKSQRSSRRSLSSLRKQKCVTHKETRGYFCVENRIYLCHTLRNSVDIVRKATSFQSPCIGKSPQALSAKAPQQMHQSFEHALVLGLRLPWEVCSFGEKHICVCQVKDNVLWRNSGKLRPEMALQSNELREMYQQLRAVSRKPPLVLLQGLDGMFRRK